MQRVPEERRTRSGSALVVVLWVVLLLSMIVIALAFDAHIESRMTSYYRKRMKAHFLMESGLQIAELVMNKSTKIRPYTDAEPDEEDRWFEPAKRLAEGDSVTLEETFDGGQAGENDGESPEGGYTVGSVTVTIVSERARRNVNRLTLEEEWESILEVGDIPEERWPELIESFLDWLDKDDNARVDGAESDYYENLETPYMPQNGPLFTVDELMLVKGFTRTILYGGVIEPESDRGDPIIVSGIADLLTTFGDRKINVNSASRRVLMTLPDRSGDLDLIVDAIIEERSGTVNSDGVVEPAYFEGDADLLRRVPELRQPKLRQYVTTSGSRYFRVTSTGKVGAVEKTVRSIVKYDGRKLTILQWREED